MLSLKSGSWFIIVALVALGCGGGDGPGVQPVSGDGDALVDEQEGGSALSDPEKGQSLGSDLGLSLTLAGRGGSESPVDPKPEADGGQSEDPKVDPVDPPVSDAGTEDPADAAEPVDSGDPEDPEDPDPVSDAGTPEEDAAKPELECIRDSDCDDNNVCTEEWCNTSTHKCESTSEWTEGDSCEDPGGSYAYGAITYSGVCRSGVCCGGCWDEVLGCMHSELSDDADFCGVQGVDCQACDGDTPACFVGTCQ